MSIQEVGDLYKVLNYFLFNQIPQVLNEAFLTSRLLLCFLFCFVLCVCVCVFFLGGEGGGGGGGGGMNFLVMLNKE